MDVFMKKKVGLNLNMNKCKMKFVNGAVGSGKTYYTLYLCAVRLLKKTLGFRYYFLLPITKKKLIDLVYDLLNSYYYN